MCQRHLAGGVEHDSAETAVHPLQLSGADHEEFCHRQAKKKYAAKRMDMHMTHVEEILWEVEALNSQTARLLENTEAEEELVRLLNEFLQTLKERDRDIFLRRYWHMDSMAELAKRHNLSESPVKSNLFRTRKKLEKIMRKERYLK